MVSYLASIFKSEPENSCRILLYYADKRVSESASKFIELRPTESHRIHELVCTYFDRNKTWDKNLIHSLLFEDIRSFQWFEMGLKENENMIYGVKVLGSTKVLIDEKKEEYQPLFRNQKLSFCVQTPARNSMEYEVYPEGSTTTKMDNSVIALLNSESFKSFAECSRDKQLVRRVAVIDLSTARL